MSDHQYYYEVRKQDPMHYIDRVLLAELVVRDPVGPRSHSAPLKAAVLITVILLAVLAAQYVSVSQRASSTAQGAEVRDPHSLITAP